MKFNQPSLQLVDSSGGQCYFQRSVKRKCHNDWHETRVIQLITHLLNTPALHSLHCSFYSYNYCPFAHRLVFASDSAEKA